MNYKGIEFEADIKQLKKLRNTDKPAYKKLMDKICKKYKTSVKTVYREMRKRKPGLRQIRNDAGKSKTVITPKEKAIAKELLEAGAKKNKVQKTLEKLTGKKVSTRKMYKIEKKNAEAKPVKSPNETAFGNNFKDFIESYFGLEYMSEEKEKTVKIAKFTFSVNKDEINDIVLVLINAYNRWAELNGKRGLKFDRLEMMRSKLYNLLAYQLKLAEAGSNIKMLESIADIYNKLKQKKVNLPLDYHVLEAICKKIDPNITSDEIIGMLKEYGEEQK